jgi:hypothetical protein
MKAYACFIIAASLVSGATDPFVGTWTLNAHKSRYAPGTCPKRMVIRMDPAGDGVHYRSETTYANGASAYSQYTADYAGTESIVTGGVGLLTPVSLRRLDSRTVQASYVRALQAVATSRRVVSKDGRVMTIATTSKDKAGNVVTNVGVYEKASTK